MKDIITVNSIFVRNEDGEMVVSSDAINAIRDMEIAVKRIKKTADQYKKALIAGMEEYNLKKVDTDELLITYVEPTERVGIDNDKLWNEYKDVAFDCQKISNVKASVRITVR